MWGSTIEQSLQGQNISVVQNESDGRTKMNDQRFAAAGGGVINKTETNRTETNKTIPDAKSKWNTIPGSNNNENQEITNKTNANRTGDNEF